jgi:ATP-dependent helicase HrpA
VEYHFAPGESHDGATLRIPLLALPGLTRTAVDAAIPGFARPRIEALLRSLPKDARRNLIPLGDTATQFLAAHHGGAAAAADAPSLEIWLKETRGVPESQLHFDLAAVPRHLIPHLTVIAKGAEIAQGVVLAELRRATAAAAAAELERHARSAYSGIGSWRRFELEELPESVPVVLEQGTILVYPTLARHNQGQALEVRYEWSPAEARRRWHHGSAQLARSMLSAQARDLTKAISSNVPLLLAAAPYATSAELVEALLQMVFRRACFADVEAPRTKDAFERVVEQGRADLHPCLTEIAAGALNWFNEARAIRRLTDEAGRRFDADAVAESHEHLQQLLSAASLESWSPEWLRQLPRYLKAEARRWQRAGARGTEPPHILRELRSWSGRHRELSDQLGAELRWIPELDDLRHWIEEYRVSLYAQELKTLGPVSAARLAARAADIEHWITR